MNNKTKTQFKALVQTDEKTGEIKEKMLSKSGGRRISRKNIQEINKILDELPASDISVFDREAKELLIEQGVDPTLINDQLIMMVCARKHAKAGNVGYFNKLMDMTGEMPNPKADLNVKMSGQVESVVDLSLTVNKMLGLDDE